MQGKTLLPTFDERNDGKGRRDYGTELADHGTPSKNKHGASDASFPLPETPESSKRRVFRVTTLETGQDYDSIPHSRLKAVLGGASWVRTVLLWLLIMLVVGCVCLVTIYMHAKSKHHRAVLLSTQVGQLDTSKNDAISWIAEERKTSTPPSRPYPTLSHQTNRAHTMATIDPRNPLKVLKAKAKETPTIRVGTLRLPLGLAVQLSLQRMVKRRDSDEDITSGHDQRYRDLVRLRDSLPLDMYEKEGDKKVRMDILRLLRVARDARVSTEVPLGGGASSWGPIPTDDLYASDKRLFLSQLERFAACAHKGAEVPCSVFIDVMRYPDSTSLQYWGKFRLLRFDGYGVMYWRNGAPAYQGMWSKGRMEGEGKLMDTAGRVVWKGGFKHGMPLGGWNSLMANYGGSIF